MEITVINPTYQILAKIWYNDVPYLNYPVTKTYAISGIIVQLRGPKSIEELMQLVCSGRALAFESMRCDDIDIIKTLTMFHKLC
jgi:hypothetical protein